MKHLSSCSDCGELLPPAVTTSCPHCDAPRPAATARVAREDRPGGFLAGFSRKLLMMTGGSVIATTLMACYGAPYRRPPPRPQSAQQCPPSANDADGDCVKAPTDCDDNNPRIRPGAVDRPGDGVDSNCDGKDG